MAVVMRIGRRRSLRSLDDALAPGGGRRGALVHAVDEHNRIVDRDSDQEDRTPSNTTTLSESDNQSSSRMAPTPASGSDAMMSTGCHSDSNCAAMTA